MMVAIESIGAMRAFVQAAETRSFKLAGQVVGLTPSAVGKAIQKLEDQLGVRLFHRSTRSDHHHRRGQPLSRSMPADSGRGGGSTGRAGRCRRGPARTAQDQFARRTDAAPARRRRVCRGLSGYRARPRHQRPLRRRDRGGFRCRDPIGRAERQPLAASQARQLRVALRRVARICRGARCTGGESANSEPIAACGIAIPRPAG